MANAPESVSYLTVREMTERLNVTRDRLDGFLKNEAVQVAVGAVDVAGVYGKRYTEESLQLLALLIDAQDKKLVTPKTAAAWLANTQREDSVSIGQELVGLPNSQRQSVCQTAELELLQAILEALTRPVEPPALANPPDDTLLTIKVAYATYGVSMGALRGMSVMEGGRRKVRKSAVLEYIRQLG